MIRMSLGNEPYIERDTGKPLEGRLTVYLHDTDTPATVYTLEGPDFVEAENPQLVHGGSVDNSLFAKTGIYDLVLEKYIGTPGQMSPESQDSDFEQVDVLECGIDFDLESMTANQVNFVADLRNVAPEMGAVTVRWYESAGDCVPRVYVWDAASVNTEDGGYVIGSDVSDTGRWILLWDDEQLPACVYGVTPGNESNMGPLLNYPDTVGSFGFKTAPIVRFQAGTYITALSYATSKALAFDQGAKFTGATFTCPTVIMNGSNTDYLADFYLTGGDTVAHSSWFRTLRAFWACNAKRLVIDAANHFEVSSIGSTVSISGAIIEGASRLSATYSAGVCLQLDGCSIQGSGIFSATSDFVKFLHTTFRSEWFSNISASSFGTIAGGQNIECKTAAVNVLALQNFSAPATYIGAVKANGNTTLDLHGATVASFSETQFNTIRNMVVSSSMSVGGCTMENVNVEGNFYCTGNSLDVTRCSLTFGSQPSSLVSFNATDSELANTSAWTSVPTMTFDRCRVRLSFNTVTDNNAEGRTVTMRNCVLDGSGNIITHKKLNLYGCVLKDQVVKIRPYKSGSYYYYSVNFDGNTFDSSESVDFDLFRGDSDDLDCYEIRMAGSICGNNFTGNAHGIKMKYWAWPSNSLKMIGTTGNTMRFSGNSGMCPKEKLTLASLASNFASYDLDGVTVYKWTTSSRVFPNLGKINANGTLDDSAGANGSFVGGVSLCSIGASVGGVHFLFRDRAVISDNTDFFSFAPYFTSAPTDYVRIV